LKQTAERGIEKFMQRIGTAYTKYFNEKYKRSGALFQGTFKSIHIDSNGLLLYLSAYINCNSEVHEIAKAEDYKWCSFSDYIGKRKGTLCEKEIILGQYKNIDEYRKNAIETAMNIARRRNFEKFLIE
jgi:putative transposase